MAINILASGVLSFPIVDETLGHLFAVVDLTDGCHQVDKLLGHVDATAELCGRVVKRKSVVVVVVSFSEGTERYKKILSRLDVLVVGLITEHVSSRVDEPRRVERSDVPSDVHDEETLRERQLPHGHRDETRTEHSEGQVQSGVVALLEANHWIRKQVGEVQLLALLLEQRMLLAQQPADVAVDSEEEEHTVSYQCHFESVNGTHAKKKPRFVLCGSPSVSLNL